MSAAENVGLPMVLNGKLSKGQIKKRSRALLARVGMAARVGHTPQQLSGGEQQRVTIARAIANKPVSERASEPSGLLELGRACRR